jgi:hypothetical protein
MTRSGAVLEGGSPQPARENNKLRIEDSSVHDWYRFVLSFPPHLVRTYLDRFAVDPRNYVLDPFCGTGTTLVECKKSGIPSIGIEPNPMPCFASRTKTDWTVDPDGLLTHALKVAEAANREMEADGIGDGDDLPLFTKQQGRQGSLRHLSKEVSDLLLHDSISPLPLHRALVLRDIIERQKDERFCGHERLALARAIVFGFSNLHFGPEVGVGPVRADAPAVSLWLNGVRAMAQDIREFQGLGRVMAAVHCADARCASTILEPESVDAVITSPPYPNEKDYTRTTRLESVLLGFIRSKQDLRALKQDLVRSNTRGVYKSDSDDLLVADYEKIQRIAEAIEARRIFLGKTSGFERLYGRVTKLYFGGMARHLRDLRVVLRPGAKLAYVVGDQASYLRIMIRTGQLLAEIADSLGYEVLSIDLFRTRLATATKAQLREEVVLLRWPGKKACRERQ